MPALAAANVIVTLNPEDIDRSPDGRIGMRTFPVVAFGNAILTYPALGIPMPDLGKFGFHFAIKRAYIEQPGNGYLYSFDRANHKVRIWLAPSQAALTIDNHIDLAVGAPTGVVTGKGLTIDLHSHGLVVAANAGIVDAIGANGSTLVMAANGPITIPGAVAANGGVANATATGNLSSNALTMAAPANMANLVHTIHGGGAVLEGAFAEMDDTVAPAATTLYMEMVGR